MAEVGKQFAEGPSPEENPPPATPSDVPPSFTPFSVDATDRSTVNAAHPASFLDPKTQELTFSPTQVGGLPVLRTKNEYVTHHMKALQKRIEESTERIPSSSKLKVTAGTPLHDYLMGWHGYDTDRNKSDISATSTRQFNDLTQRALLSSSSEPGFDPESDTVTPRVLQAVTKQWSQYLKSDLDPDHELKDTLTPIMLFDRRKLSGSSTPSSADIHHLFTGGSVYSASGDEEGTQIPVTAATYPVEERIGYHAGKLRSAVIRNAQSWVSATLNDKDTVNSAVKSNVIHPSEVLPNFDVTSLDTSPESVTAAVKKHAAKHFDTNWRDKWSTQLDLVTKPPTYHSNEDLWSTYEKGAPLLFTVPPEKKSITAPGKTEVIRGVRRNKVIASKPLTLDPEIEYHLKAIRSLLPQANTEPASIADAGSSLSKTVPVSEYAPELPEEAGTITVKHSDFLNMFGGHDAVLRGEIGDIIPTSHHVNNFMKLVARSADQFAADPHIKAGMILQGHAALVRHAASAKMKRLVDTWENPAIDNPHHHAAIAAKGMSDEFAVKAQRILGILAVQNSEEANEKLEQIKAEIQSKSKSVIPATELTNQALDRFALEHLDIDAKELSDTIHVPVGHTPTSVGAITTLPGNLPTKLRTVGAAGGPQITPEEQQHIAASKEALAVDIKHKRRVDDVQEFQKSHVEGWKGKYLSEIANAPEEEHADIYNEYAQSTNEATLKHAQSLEQADPLPPRIHEGASGQYSDEFNKNFEKYIAALKQHDEDTFAEEKRRAISEKMREGKTQKQATQETEIESAQWKIPSSVTRERVNFALDLAHVDTSKSFGLDTSKFTSGSPARSSGSASTRAYEEDQAVRHILESLAKGSHLDVTTLAAPSLYSEKNNARTSSGELTAAVGLTEYDRARLGINSKPASVFLSDEQVAEREGKENERKKEMEEKLKNVEDAVNARNGYLATVKQAAGKPRTPKQHKEYQEWVAGKDKYHPDYRKEVDANPIFIDQFVIDNIIESRLTDPKSKGGEGLEKQSNQYKTRFREEEQKIRYKGVNKSRLRKKDLDKWYEYQSQFGEDNVRKRWDEKKQDIGDSNHTYYHYLLDLPERKRKLAEHTAAIHLANAAVEEAKERHSRERDEYMSGVARKNARLAIVDLGQGNPDKLDGLAASTRAEEQKLRDTAETLNAPTPWPTGVARYPETGKIVRDINGNIAFPETDPSNNKAKFSRENLSVDLETSGLRQLPADILGGGVAPLGVVAASVNPHMGLEHAQQIVTFTTKQDPMGVRRARPLGTLFNSPVRGDGPFPESLPESESDRVAKSKTGVPVSTFEGQFVSLEQGEDNEHYLGQQGPNAKQAQASTLERYLRPDNVSDVVQVPEDHPLAALNGMQWKDVRLPTESSNTNIGMSILLNNHNAARIIHAESRMPDMTDEEREKAIANGAHPSAAKLFEGTAITRALVGVPQMRAIVGRGGVVRGIHSHDGSYRAGKGGSVVSLGDKAKKEWFDSWKGAADHRASQSAVAPASATTFALLNPADAPTLDETHNRIIFGTAAYLDKLLQREQEDELSGKLLTAAVGDRDTRELARVLLSGTYAAAQQSTTPSTFYQMADTLKKHQDALTGRWTVHPTTGRLTRGRNTSIAKQTGVTAPSAPEDPIIRPGHGWGGTISKIDITKPLTKKDLARLDDDLAEGQKFLDSAATQTYTGVHKVGSRNGEHSQFLPQIRAHQHVGLSASEKAEVEGQSRYRRNDSLRDLDPDAVTTQKLLAAARAAAETFQSNETQKRFEEEIKKRAASNSRDTENDLPVTEEQESAPLDETETSKLKELNSDAFTALENSRQEAETLSASASPSMSDDEKQDLQNKVADISTAAEKTARRALGKAILATYPKSITESLNDKDKEYVLKTGKLPQRVLDRLNDALDLIADRAYKKAEQDRLNDAADSGSGTLVTGPDGKLYTQRELEERYAYPGETEESRLKREAADAKAKQAVVGAGRTYTSDPNIGPTYLEHIDGRKTVLKEHMLSAAGRDQVLRAYVQAGGEFYTDPDTGMVSIAGKKIPKSDMDAKVGKLLETLAGKGFSKEDISMVMGSPEASLILRMAEKTNPNLRLADNIAMDFASTPAGAKTIADRKAKGRKLAWQSFVARTGTTSLPVSKMVAPLFTPTQGDDETDEQYRTRIDKYYSTHYVKGPDGKYVTKEEYAHLLPPKLVGETEKEHLARAKADEKAFSKNALDGTYVPTRGKRESDESYRQRVDHYLASEAHQGIAFKGGHPHIPGWYSDKTVELDKIELERALYEQSVYKKAGVDPRFGVGSFLDDVGDVLNDEDIANLDAFKLREKRVNQEIRERAKGAPTTPVDPETALVNRARAFDDELAKQVGRPSDRGEQFTSGAGKPDNTGASAASNTTSARASFTDNTGVPDFAPKGARNFTPVSTFGVKIQPKGSSTAVGSSQFRDLLNGRDYPITPVDYSGSSDEAPGTQVKIPESAGTQAPTLTDEQAKEAYRILRHQHELQRMMGAPFSGSGNYRSRSDDDDDADTRGEYYDVGTPTGGSPDSPIAWDKANGFDGLHSLSSLLATHMINMGPAATHSVSLGDLLADLLRKPTTRSAATQAYDFIKQKMLDNKIALAAPLPNSVAGKMSLQTLGKRLAASPRSSISKIVKDKAEIMGEIGNAIDDKLYELFGDELLSAAAKPSTEAHPAVATQPATEAGKLEVRFVEPKPRPITQKGPSLRDAMANKYGFSMNSALLDDKEFVGLLDRQDYPKIRRFLDAYEELGGPMTTEDRNAIFNVLSEEGIDKDKLEYTPLSWVDDGNDDENDGGNSGQDLSTLFENFANNAGIGLGSEDPRKKKKNGRRGNFNRGAGGV